MRKTIETLFFVLWVQVGFTQTAYIKVDTEILPDHFKNIVFIINGEQFTWKTSGLKRVNVNPDNFDSLEYYYHDAPEVINKVQCKLIDGRHYTISACVCCGDFSVAPDTLPRRGMVRFVNDTDKKLIGIRSEVETDTILPNSNSGYLPSYISMNCGFRPFDIEIQDSYASFLFLHGEKVSAIYDSSNKKVRLQLDGYLTEEEYIRDYLKQ